MSGIQMAVAAAGGFRTVASPVDFAGSNTDIGGTVTIRFNPDGTVDSTVDGTIGPDGSWGTPTVAGVGAAYWIKFLAKSAGAGTFSTPAALPTGWVSLAAAQSCIMDAPPLHQARSATVPYQIATDSAGTNVVLSGNLNYSSNLL